MSRDRGTQQKRPKLNIKWKENPKILLLVSLTWRLLAAAAFVLLLACSYTLWMNNLNEKPIIRILQPQQQYEKKGQL